MCFLISLIYFKNLIYTLPRMLTDLACKQFSLKEDLPKELGLRPCQMLVCLSIKTS